MHAFMTCDRIPCCLHTLLLNQARLLVTLAVVLHFRQVS